jgi:hypothetical protein
MLDPNVTAHDPHFVLGDDGWTGYLSRETVQLLRSGGLSHRSST